MRLLLRFSFGCGKMPSQHINMCLSMSCLSSRNSELYFNTVLLFHMMH